MNMTTYLFHVAFVFGLSAQVSALKAESANAEDAFEKRAEANMYTDIVGSMFEECLLAPNRARA